MAGIYLHIPFCKQACHYCDFHFSTQQDSKADLVKSLSREVELQKNYLENETIDTVYFGGGTPSLLNEKELSSIFNSFHQHFKISKEAEITLEANPDDLTKENLTLFKNAGINRLSIGIQSFDDVILKFLNRAHSAGEALACVDLARNVGFGNISIDLIYTIPGQSDDLWKKNIERAIALSPEHISAYSLTIEEKTVFGNWKKKGKLKTEGDDFAAGQMELLMELLTTSGYEHYEISNFSKPNFHSRHNSSYWRQKKYLGVGPSAHSYNVNSRQFNISNNSLYIQSIAQGKIPSQIEILSQADKINDYLLTSLRTEWGCDLTYLQNELGYDLLNVSKKEVEVFLSHKFLELDGSTLLLTRKGKFLADKIAADLFAEE